MLQVSGLYIYPIKSMRGIAVDKAKVTDRGFAYDRRWMLVDENNRFISQREVPQLALMRIEIQQHGLLVTYLPANSFFFVPFVSESSEFGTVTIWDDTVTGQYVSREADQWFTGMLDINCRLVCMPDNTKRITNQRHAPANSIVSFADGYPVMIIGQASLDELNSKLVVPIPMNRFRPNIVFTGSGPYAEDLMHTVMIGDIPFFGVKLCERCNIPSIDQDTAVSGKEPLKTLARYRFKNNNILFGQNLVPAGLGEIAVGDSIEVLKWHIEERFMVSASYSADS